MSAKIYKPSDMEDKLIQMAEDAEKIFVRGEYLILNFSYEYEIGVDRIQSYREILEWVAHLIHKTWMNPHRISLFIDAATDAAGLQQIEQ
jgi:hypothetical protein